MAATVTAPDGVDVAAVHLELPPDLVPTHRRAGRCRSRPATGRSTWSSGCGPSAGGGARPVRPSLRATAGYGMLSWPPVRTETATLTTWPLRDGFDAADTVPRAEGLVGAHVSRRPGEGGDLAGVRPFVPGDRLRRINWRVTGRTGELHVTATYSDRDAEVLLLLDSAQDLGRAPESSLDIGVRAAAAIAEHYLRAGDRVGLVDLGSPQRRVPPRNGRSHLVRLLDVLLDARPAPGPRAVTRRRAEAARAQLAARAGRAAQPADPPGRAGGGRDGRPVRAGRWWRSTRCRRTCGRTGAASGRSWRSGSGGCAATADLDRLAELGVPVVAWGGAGCSTRCCGTRAGAPHGRPGAVPDDRAAGVVPDRRSAYGRLMLVAGAARAARRRLGRRVPAGRRRPRRARPGRGGGSSRAGSGRRW